MADSWPDGDPMERGAGSGLFGGLWETGTKLAGAVGKGAASGFGLGDGAAITGGQAVADKMKAGAVKAVAGQYPGFGSLWTYDTQNGLAVTRAGQIGLGVAAVALWLALSSGGR